MDEPRPPPPAAAAPRPSPRPGLAHAALWGLLGAFLVGGLVLLALAARALWGAPDCTGLEPAECFFAQQTARELGRMQALSGSALCLLALASLLYLRASGAGRGGPRSAA